MRSAPGSGAVRVLTGPGLLLALLWGVVRPGPLVSQVEEPPPGGVRGVVFDSTTGAPLSEADVFLWGTPHRALTEADGSFLIEGVPPGAYTAIFFHPKLAELGISPGGKQVEVLAGERTPVTLTVPSTYTLLAAQCALEGAGAAAGGVPVVGRVTDAATGVAYPRAHVRLSWTPRGTQTGHIEVVTDESGWFSACAAPPDVAIGVIADFLGRTSPRHEVELERGHPAHLDLPIGNLAPAVLTGRVIDAASGVAVEGATVALEGTGLAAVTKNDGSFRVEEITPGTYTLAVRHLPYAPRDESVFLTSGQVTNVVLQMAEEAVPVEPLVVTVERTSLVDRAMGGLVVGREEIDKVAPRVRDLADVLREQHLPGLIVRRNRIGPCVGFSTGQVRMHGRSGCVPVTVFIDGARATDPYAVFTIPADAIDRMVLYRPIEAGNLFGAGSANGVLEVYTRW